MVAHSTINDGGTPGTTPETPRVSSNLVDEIYSERLKTLPNMPARPGDPHYVGQTYWDTAEGLLDLNSGKFTQGKDEINTAIGDLGKESTLITGAQADGKTASQDILNSLSDTDPNKAKCDLTSAENTLTKTINDLHLNYYNTADRNDYKQALADLKSGDTTGAEAEIAKAEKALGIRETKVTTASADLTTGLKEFNSGHQNEGEEEMRDAMDKLHLKPHCEVNPGGPNRPEPTSIHIPPIDYRTTA